MRSIARHDHGQKPERIKFLRLLFACPVGAGKWRILSFCYAFAWQKEGLAALRQVTLRHPFRVSFVILFLPECAHFSPFFDKLKGRTVFTVLPCFLSFQKTRQRRRIKLIDRFEASFIKYAQLLNTQGSSFAFCRVLTSSAIDEPPSCPSISGYPQCSSRA